MPLFDYLYTKVDDIAAFRSLSDICLLLDYFTYTPGATIVDFGMPADRLIIIVGGKVCVCVCMCVCVCVCLFVYVCVEMCGCRCDEERFECDVTAELVHHYVCVGVCW